MRLYLAEHYGDIASVVGLMIAIVGFVITIKGVRKAERAANEARRDAKEAVERLRLQAFLNDVGGSLQLTREIVASCRAKQWIMAIDRCEQARVRLAKLGEDPRLVEDRSGIDAALTTLGTFVLFLVSKQEKTPEKSLTRQKSSDLDAIVVFLGRLCAKIAATMEEA